MTNRVIELPLGPAIEQELMEERLLQEFLDQFGMKPMGGGAAGAWVFTTTGRQSILNGTFDFDSDTFKIALFLSTSNLTTASTTYAGVTNEHANQSGSGYLTGGAATTVTVSAPGATITVDASNVQWTATGGSITAKWAALYEVSGNVVCFALLDSGGADVTVTVGNILTIEIHASGVFTLSGG